jgi:hypothetical protein
MEQFFIIIDIEESVMTIEGFNFQNNYANSSYENI